MSATTQTKLRVLPEREPETHAASHVVDSPQALREELVRPHPAQRERIGEWLASEGKLQSGELTSALADQRTHPTTRLGELLVARGKIADDDLYRALSAKLGLPYVRLGGFLVEPEALAKVPQDVVRIYRVLPLLIDRSKLVLAMRDPTDSETIATLSVLTRMQIEPVLATPHDIDDAIATHYPAFDEDALREAAEQLHRPERVATNEEASAEKLAQQQPIVRLVSNMLQDAVQRRASDIHIRPRERSAEVLYRIDGALVRVREFASTLLPAVVARVKVLADMDLAEHRRPQDGAIHLTAGKRAVDLRVSMMPSLYGENVVIRILDRSVGLRRMSDIGFTPTDEKKFRALINRNQGLVLVTGPTGSGKTTTLYAALQELNSGEFHILTVEDPVEYRLDGIVQMQVHEAIDFGFGTALRHILRHDPDVILIGEMRDREAANIAMESALTGHLVLSTLHTNSAAQTITRLIEMGVPPYLLNATLAGVLAQRLVRRNCAKCKTVEDVSAEIRDTLGVEQDEVFYQGRGCPECAGTGARGRIAVYELLQMSPSLRALVRRGANDDELQAVALREGMTALTRQALQLARAGEICLKEVFRARLE